jgi:hypothetical protein
MRRREEHALRTLARDYLAGKLFTKRPDEDVELHFLPIAFMRRPSGILKHAGLFYEYKSLAIRNSDIYASCEILSPEDATHFWSLVQDEQRKSA